MKLHRQSLFRGSLSLEVTPSTLRCERRSFRGCHSFEAPLSEVSPTFESVSATAYGSYTSAILCLVFAGLQYHPPEEIHVWTFVITVPLVLLAGYFVAVARGRSGDYSIVRSTKESSRDIWILRSGAEREVDQFLSELRLRLLPMPQPPNKAPEPTPGSVTPRASS